MDNSEEFNDKQFSVDDIISEFLAEDLPASSVRGIGIEEETASPRSDLRGNSQRTRRETSKEKHGTAFSKVRSAIPSKLDFSGIKDRFSRSGKDDYSYDYDDDSEPDIAPVKTVSKSPVSEPPVRAENSAADSADFDVFYSGSDSRPGSDDLDEFIKSFKSGKYIDISNEPVSEPVIQSEPDARSVMEQEIPADPDDSSPDDTVIPAFDTEQETRSEGARDTIVGNVLGKVFRRSSKSTEEYDIDPDYDGINDTAEFAKKRELIPSDFKQFIASEVMTLIYKIKGTTEAVLTTSDISEDLGPEVSSKKASTYYGSYIKPIRLRFRVSIVLLIILAWISLGMPVSGMLKDNRTATAVCLGFQLVIMLLSLDVISNAIMNAVRGRLGFDFLAFISCVVTSLDAAFVASAKVANEHLALCFISSLSLVGVLASSLLYARGLRKAIRVPAIGRKEFTVTAEYDPKNREISILKSGKPVVDFVHRSEEISPDENMYEKLSLFILVISFFLAFILAIAKKDFADLLYLYSAVLCPAVPFCGVLCFAVPFLEGSNKLFSYGAAISGWSGVYDIGHSKNLIITDSDLFPDGTVDLSEIKIPTAFDPDKTIAYAGSMIIASGSCIAKPFSDYMQHRGLSVYPVKQFEILPGGGFKGIIDRKVIYCGSSGFMRLQGFRIPANKISRYSVLIAEDGKISGIFDIEYKGLPEVRAALVKLIDSGRIPIFAVRDFNISHEMLHDIFDLPTDGYNFPPFVERFSVSTPRPDSESKISAVVCREGLAPIVAVTDTGTKIYNASKMNLIITIPGSLLAAMIVFFRILSTGSVSILLLFVFSLILSIPVIVRSLFLRF